MKKFLLSFCALFIGLGMLTFDAEARRMGGGGSFGMQRSPSTAPRPATPPSAPAAAPAKPAPNAAAPQPSGMSRWLGPLAGIAAGVGLAALFSHMGIGGGMGSLLLILALAVGVFFVARLLFARRQPAPQYAGAGAPARFEAMAPTGGGASGAAATVNVPAGFDVAGFLRNAKLNFVRLQAAHDAGNLADIREFTTPEVYAEIKLQIDERRGAAQATDVVQVDAELVDLVTEETRHIASVHFRGLIREEANAQPEHFDEVWHLTKPVDGSSGWTIAGIQQVQ